jgi:hypothetical protein
MNDVAPAISEEKIVELSGLKLGDFLCVNNKDRTISVLDGAFFSDGSRQWRDFKNTREAYSEIFRNKSPDTAGQIMFVFWKRFRIPLLQCARDNKNQSHTLQINISDSIILS